MVVAPATTTGEPILERTVSFLELFYDLVYVAVVSQAAHHLADHVSLRGVAEFAVVFALIWIGWLNGTLYLELHGREDGRTRTVVFVQMGILVVLAVFTGEAAGSGGWASRSPTPLFQALLTWLWSRCTRGSPRPPGVPLPDEALRHRHRRVDGGDVRQRLPSRRPTTRRVDVRGDRLDRRPGGARRTRRSV